MIHGEQQGEKFSETAPCWLEGLHIRSCYTKVGVATHAFGSAVEAVADI